MGTSFRANGAAIVAAEELESKGTRPGCKDWIPFTPLVDNTAMLLYLVQHGEAKAKNEDPERPLTEEGAEHARRMAAQATRLGVQVSEIWSSDKRRATETAELFARALDAPRSVREGLAPNDDVSPLVEELRGTSENLLIVGHLPHLSRLASALVVQDSTKEIVLFHNAGIVRLDREDEEFQIRWVLPPEITG